MSFKLIEKENNEDNQKINEENPISDENRKNKIIEQSKNIIVNNEYINNINNIKIDLTLNNNFDFRKDKLRINREAIKRLMKNKTQGELRNFRNKSYKKFFDLKKNSNTLNNLSKFNLHLNQTLGFIDKEKIKNEIYHLKQEMKIIDEELNGLKEKYKESQNKFMANKIIIEKVLNISEEEEKKKLEESKQMEESKRIQENKKTEEKSESNLDNKNNNKRGNTANIYLTQLVSSDITKDETKDDKTNEEILNEKNNENKNNTKKKNNIAIASIKKKKNNSERIKFIKIKNRIKVNNFSRLVVCLKRENSDYDKSIESTSKLIESKMKDGKVNIFLNLNCFIENKNKVLEELYSKRNFLLNKLNESNQKICAVVLRTKKGIEDQKKIEKILNNNNIIIDKYQKTIKLLLEDKDNLGKGIKLLEEEKDDMVKIKEQKDEEKKELEEKMKNKEDTYNEKNNDIKELDDLNINENNMKKTIHKNDVNIKKLKNNIKDYENKMKNYPTTIKLYEDYIKIKEEIKIFRKNNKLGKAVEDNQEISKSNLINKLSELSNELTEKNKKCDELKDELNKLKIEYKETRQNIDKVETEVQKEENKIDQEKINTPNNIEEKEENEEKEEKEEKKENIKETKKEDKNCIIF